MRTFVSGILFVIATALLTVPSYSQVAQNYKQEAVLLKKVIVANHYDPPPVDDSLSDFIYRETLEGLDPDHAYFSLDDLSSVEPYRYRIDDELSGTQWSFLTKLTAVYKDCLLRQSALLKKLTDKPLLPATSEFTSLPLDSTWTANLDELEERWKHNLIVTELFQLADMFTTDSMQVSNTFVQTHEVEARLRIRAAKQHAIEHILNYPGGFESHVASIFFQSIASAFDPHTSYFSASDVENFVGSLSTDSYTFGFIIDEDERGNFAVERLVPGGPAWNCGEVHTGDELIKIKLSGGNWIDLFGATLEEITSLLQNAGHEGVDFLFRTKQGVQLTVRLTKAQIAITDDMVRSCILDGEKRIGYIHLPDFYTDWSAGGSRCANDVASEIIKLKRDSIEGLILDLRFNGGGSLKEAVDMAGIFIDAGPIGIYRTRSGQEEVMKDMNRGTIWDGPMVVMVNSLSASASEFLAAALQDYHRALITGSTTYGKATGQILFSVDNEKELNGITANYQKDQGVANVTVEKIYRVTGRTAQRTGIEPDIVLPDILPLLVPREAIMPHALPADTLSKKIYFNRLPPLPVELVKAASQRRTAKLKKPDESELKDWIDKDLHSDFPLEWEEFLKLYDRERTTLEDIDSVAGDSSVFVVRNHEFDKKRMAIDQELAKLNENWKRDLLKDAALQENYLIISDLTQAIRRR